MKKSLIIKILSVLMASAVMVSCGADSVNDENTSDTDSEVGTTDISPDDVVYNTEADGSVGEIILSDYSPDVLFKAENNQNNPLITNIFCADPTSVEYNGRLYVYGTNDNQQYLEKGDSENTYERIKSFVIISTDDMVNWRYEGEINTAEIATWIYASWAPSVVSRVEEDGLTHFYLYFSNSGAGVGVLTSTDPAGPWSDPLGMPLIYSGMAGLENCPNPFDPGVCIDDDGVGWLSFGGGVAPEGTSYMPGTARICRLGKDMLSIDSEFAEIPAPYFFEASELNYINGTYVYTYNSSWETRLEWNWDSGIMAPAACSMCYMTSKTPLDTDSWEYRDYYLKNPGELGMEYSNNHSHLQKYNDKYYLLFHTLILQKARGIDKGFRSLCVNEAVVDEENVTITRCLATPKGAKQIKNLDPYQVNQTETAYLTDCEYKSEDGITYAHCEGENVIAVKGVDFSEGSKYFAVKTRGQGRIEVYPDSFRNELLSQPSASVHFNSDEWTDSYDVVINISGVHDIFFVMSGDFDFDTWEFVSLSGKNPFADEPVLLDDGSYSMSYLHEVQDTLFSVMSEYEIGETYIRETDNKLYIGLLNDDRREDVLSLMKKYIEGFDEGSVEFHHSDGAVLC